MSKKKNGNVILITERMYDICNITQFYVKLYTLFYLSSAVFMKGNVYLHQEYTGECVCGVCVRITDSRARL